MMGYMIYARNIEENAEVVNHIIDSDEGRSARHSAAHIS